MGEDDQSLYQPLGDGYIRLLKLEGRCLLETERPHAPDLAIRCSLHTVSWSEIKDGQVSYRALSYVWGSRHAPRTIICNGHHRPVTRNLYDALWQFTTNVDTVPHFLWVDAVCVNQEDLVEKTSQVAMMSDVYRQAEMVLIWLGSGSGDHEAVFDEQSWHHMVDEDSKIDDDYGTDDEIEETGSDSKTSDVVGIPPQRALRRMHRLVESSAWQRRIWTFQEIVLARNAQLHHGPFHMDWHRFTAKGARIYSIPMLRAINGYQMSHTYRTLAKLMEETCSKASTNPLDRIYALLGLYDGDCKIRPDYEKTTPQLCALVTMVLAEEANCLFLGKDSIYSTGGALEKYTSFSLAANPNDQCVSWIPNWTLAVTNRFIIDFTRRGLHVYPSLHPSFRRHVHLKDTSIVARGVILGRWINHSQNSGLLTSQSQRSVNAQEATASGRFTTFPSCMQHGRRNAATQLEQGSDGTQQEDHNGPAYFDAAEMAEAWHSHVSRSCLCTKAAPNDRLISECLPWTPEEIPWLCLIFGCPDVIILQPRRQETSNKFAILGILGEGTGWSQALEHIEWATGEESRGQDPSLNLSIVTKIMGPPSSLTASHAWTDRSENGTSGHQAVGGSCLHWIPTHFELDGDLPQKRPGVWRSPSLSQKRSRREEDEDEDEADEEDEPTREGWKPRIFFSA